MRSAGKRSAGINRAEGGKRAENPGTPRAAVWALLARGTFYKILGVLGLMAAVETALFYGMIKNENPYMSVEEMMEGFGSVVFPIALGLVFLILIRMEGLWEAKSGNTLMRLRITGRELFGIRTVYNALCMLLTFAAQIALALFLIRLYEARLPGIPPQHLFLAFYRSEFLHCLLPAADVRKWARNILLIAAFSMEAADCGGRRRQVTQIMLYIITALWFVTPVYLVYGEIICDIMYAAVIAADLAKAGSKGR